MKWHQIDAYNRGFYAPVLAAYLLTKRAAARQPDRVISNRVAYLRRKLRRSGLPPDYNGPAAAFFGINSDGTPFFNPPGDWTLCLIQTLEEITSWKSQ